MRDKWLVEKRKPSPDVKTQIKKVANSEKKFVEKQVKALKTAKNKIKARLLEMIKLATTNKRVEEIGTFKKILFDPVNGNKEDIMPTPDPILSTLLLKKSK